MPRHTGILYLDRNRFDFALPSSLRVVSAVIPLEIIKDLEVVNQELLNKLITAFIAEHQIPACSLILIISANILFEKDLSDQKEDQLAPVIEQFLDLIPFERVTKKIVKEGKKVTVIAVNQNLLKAVETAFAVNHCPITLALPGSVSGLKISPNALDTPTSKRIIHMSDSLKMYNLWDVGHSQPSTSHPTSGPTPQKKHRHLVMLVAIFMVLIGVLIFLVVRNRQLIKTVPKKSRSGSTVSLTPTAGQLPVILEPTETVEGSSLAEISEIKITILNALDFASVSALIKNRLTAVGFTTVELGKTHVVSEKTLVVFGHDAPPAVRDMLIQEITALSPQAVFQDGNEPGTDIAVTLGKTL